MASGSTANTNAAFVPPTQKVVTVQRTVVHRVKGTGRVVTQIQKVAIPASRRERVVTLRGNGTTLVEEVTVQRPGRETKTVRQTVERPTTITNSVTTPGRTVTSAGATQTVTRSVAEPGSTQTVTRTVTEPAQTITNTVTTTETIAATVTEPVTVTVTVPVQEALLTADF